MSALTSGPHGRIDVHHHYVPPAYAEAMRRAGIRDVAGAGQADGADHPGGAGQGADQQGPAGSVVRRLG